MRLPGYPTDLMEMIELAGQNDELVLREEVVPITTAARHRMVLRDRWKLLYVPTPSGPVFHLYDRRADPEETVDLALREPGVVAELTTELRRFVLVDPTLEERGGLFVPKGAKLGSATVARP
jgi:hypothetical protein